MRRNSYLKLLSLLISFSIVFISTFIGKVVMAATDGVDSNLFSYNYQVDYIRLYQDPANADNGLIYLNDNGEKVDYYNK